MRKGSQSYVAKVIGDVSREATGELFGAVDTKKPLKLLSKGGANPGKEHCLTDQCGEWEMAIKRKGTYLLGAFLYKTKCLRIFHNWQYVRTDIARFKYCKRCYKREKELPPP